MDRIISFMNYKLRLINNARAGVNGFILNKKEGN